MTGTEIGSYNYDGANLRGLLERILAETDVERLRLSSLQPQEISPELIGLWRDGRLCRHFHLSLQSGSDGVLRRMKRRYTAGDYQQAVSLIREWCRKRPSPPILLLASPVRLRRSLKRAMIFAGRWGLPGFMSSPTHRARGLKLPRCQTR